MMMSGKSILLICKRNKKNAKKYKKYLKNEKLSIDKKGSREYITFHRRMRATRSLTNQGRKQSTV